MIVRPLLFKMDPETAHHLALRMLSWAQSIPGGVGLLRMMFGVSDQRLEREVFGLKFPSPIGLAAGFDKNARVVRALTRLGFGFVEVGAVSRSARPGNPRPRIFRLPDDQALINRMGLPNDGVDATTARLKKAGAQPVPVFANVVKTSDLEGSLDVMAEDFVATLRHILPAVDGVSVNISCPASPELSAFNRRDAMTTLLKVLNDERRRQAGPEGRLKAMLLKVSPDLDSFERDVVFEVAMDRHVDGLILTNTTTRRPDGLKARREIIEQRGGLSGRPLFAGSLAWVNEFASRTEGRVPIVGVGGIFSGDDVRQMMDAGATLVEIYTSFVYEGPSQPRRLARGIVAK